MEDADRTGDDHLAEEVLTMAMHDNVNGGRGSWRLRVFAGLTRVIGVHPSMLPGWARDRLNSVGISREDIEAITRDMRGLNDWRAAWERAGDTRTASGDVTAALICYHMAQRSFFHAVCAEDAALNSKIAAVYRTATSIHPAPLRSIEFEHAHHRVSAYLQLPEGVQSPPVIVLVPGALTHKEDYHFYVDRFVQQGYGVLRFDLPGHGESAHRISHETTSIVTSAIHMLVDRYSIAPERVHVLAWCFGGLLALHSALDVAPTSISLVSTPYRPHEQVDRYPAVTRAALTRYSMVSSREEGVELLKSWAFDRDAHRLKVPVRIYSGALDPMVPESDAYAMESDLAGPTELTIFPNEYHGCASAMNEVCNGTVAWIERWKDPDHVETRAA